MTGDISDALLGAVWVLLAAFSPLAVLQFVHFASEQITAANTTGTAAALRNASRSADMTRHGAAALAGGAGAVGGWLAARATLGGKSPAPSGPAAAVGSRPGTAGAGRGSVGGKSAAGGPAGSGVGGSGSGSTPSSGPPVDSSGSPGEDPSAAADPGADPPALTPAAATGAPDRGESPDSAQWPRMNEFIGRTADESRHHPYVHPATAADALSIPRSQADRMFLYAETQGRLGPQQVDGSRRVLLNDRLPTPTTGGPRP